MLELDLRPLCDGDAQWVEAFIAERWGAPVVVAHGERYRAAELSGFVASAAGEPVGLLTYAMAGASCEIVTLDSTREQRGVGSALVARAAAAARARGCSRLWLVTTNDNLDAIRFYQKRGFELVAVHRGAAAAARRLKPEIPELGAYGIPIRDELELELLL